MAKTIDSHPQMSGRNLSHSCPILARVSTSAPAEIRPIAAGMRQKFGLNGHWPDERVGQQCGAQLPFSQANDVSPIEFEISISAGN